MKTSVRALGAVLCLVFLGCSEHRRKVVVPGGTNARDFQSLEDYLSHPVVKRILRNMPRYKGAIPPDPSGSYSFGGAVISGTLSPAGAPASADFCFGSPVGDRLIVAVNDPTVWDVGAASCIEGQGDFFTVYTAFKSVQTGCHGGTCEIHQVTVFSGRRLADGDLGPLYVGFGVVGVIGDCCGSPVPGDFQVSSGYGTYLGAGCSPGGGAEPLDPSKVRVLVENNLVVELLVYIDDETVPRLYLPALALGSFETLPGFSLYFESLQPSAGQDEHGNDILMGEIVSGLFPVDRTPAGSGVTYSIENVVGLDEYFAPLPINRTRGNIFSVVNLGLDIPWYPEPGLGLDCGCSMAPDVYPYVIGYYSYSLPGIILPEQANVYFYFVTNWTVPIASFFGPFPLEPLSGAVTLTVY